ncbi:trypsin [Drosophila pseudoobscura]|uniref:Trypsin n=1 Tax=Drosophila pseudoobscura pseudoobscura TaxID=46245 RepID=A0A6I8V231_DROPS|nr:trypsin [Drosophila pseudoobscura]
MWCKSIYLLLLLGLQCLQINATRLKQYKENYHRPVYYNPSHSKANHVDYNREALDARDKLDKEAVERTVEFDASVDKTYYMHIYYKGTVFCPGALISRRMIITSARCFMPPTTEPVREYKARYMYVLTGVDIGHATTTTPHAVNAFYMPGHKENGTSNDIALISLAKKLPRDTYQYIKLYRGIPKAGDRVKMAFLDPSEYEITLYDTKVVDMDRCKTTYEMMGLNEFIMEPEYYCVSNLKHNLNTACSTRPGDPLIIENQLAAINIFGENCDEVEDTDTMDIYFPIKHTIKFIQLATDALRAFTGTGPFNESVQTTTLSAIALAMQKEQL